MKRYLKIALYLLGTLTSFSAMAQHGGNDVIVLEKEEHKPEGAKMLGKIKIGDAVFKTNCGYEKVLEEAKEKARREGANIVKLTEVKEPDGWSSCYRIKADIYFATDISAYQMSQQRAEDSVSRLLLPDTASYALIYVYRPRLSLGSVISYILHLDDAAIGRVKNNAGFILRVPNTGKVKLWARTESRDEVTVDVARGHAYFLRCTIKMGVLIGEPHLQLVGMKTGLREFNKVLQQKEEDKEDNE